MGNVRKTFLGVDDSQAHQLELHFLLDCAQQVFNESEGLENIGLTFMVHCEQLTDSHRASASEWIRGPR